MKRFGIMLATVAALVLPTAALADLSPSDFKNAAKFCNAVRSHVGEASFRQTYGSNRRHHNALGRCVSKLARVHDRAETNAAQQCGDERATDPAGFDQKYGSGDSSGQASSSNRGPGDGPRADHPRGGAFGKCVSEHARTDLEDLEGDVGNAAKACRAERRQDDGAFEDKYGTNHNHRNAFGKCVSRHVRDAQRNDDQGDDSGDQGDGNGSDVALPAGDSVAEPAQA
jgi:hypothetical protein